MRFPYCDVHDEPSLLWVHVAILTLCGILVISSTISQFQNAAPYGRHGSNAKGWGPPIPQRLGHILSDGPWNVFGFLGIFLLYSGVLPQSPHKAFSELSAPNIVLALGWLVHYVHRGWIHPLIMQYSSATVPIGITLAGLFPNILFGYLIAAQLGCAIYPHNWVRDPRFIIGVILYGTGFIINRHSDWYLQSLRRKHKLNAVQNQDLLQASKSEVPTPTEVGKPTIHASTTEQASANNFRDKYFIPHGGLFDYVSCPNYFGELLEWSGYALAAFSYPELLWALFGASTFVPRSLTHHKWYKEHFGDEYPANRKALIPFIL